MEILFLIVVSYLIGAIPFSLIFAKILGGIDVRRGGSGNIGATNVLVTTGKKRIAACALFFDMVKGFAVVAFAKIFFGADIYAYTAGFFAIIGHDFPFYLKFRGGKGVATTTGALIALNPLAIWYCVSVYVISIIATRYLILSSLISIAAIPFVLWGLGEGGAGIIFGSLSFLLALYVHRGDIERLLAGKEKKVSQAVGTLML